MVEKTAAKKDLNKKNLLLKPNEKHKKNKTNHQNGTKYWNEQPIHLSSYGGQKKKDKCSKNDSKLVLKKNSESFLKRLVQIFIIRGSYVFIFLGFLYIVDYEKFSHLKNGAEALLDKTVSYLPEVVVSTGRQTVKYVRPVVEFTVEKSKFLLSETSNFLSTNPLLKDHWINIKEISLISGACIIDYIQTLYLQITRFWPRSEE